jgi:malate dehydrogenase (oxaloacetate-decarboxylating)
MNTGGRAVYLSVDLLPLTDQLRETSAAVAVAVARDQVTRHIVDDTIGERVRAAMWRPVYRPIEAV